MKYVLVLILFSINTLFVNAQKVDYNRIQMPNIQKVATINFGEIEDKFESQIEYLKAPEVSGDNYKQYLKRLKENLKVTHPKTSATNVQQRGAADPPTIERSFVGNTTSFGAPLDPHLSISNGKQIISCVNSHISIHDNNGEVLNAFGLSGIAGPAGVFIQQLFDPRVFYDHVEDRFVLTFLAGSNSQETVILIAFSQTNDATGDWNIYTLPGNPNMETLWSDYPMVNITANDFLLTMNFIREGVSWQLGFEETVIWQVDKFSGYNGEALVNELWQDVELDGTNIRNLCPVKSGDGTQSNNAYFLSNKNFSVESDTFYIIELTGPTGDPNTTLNVEQRTSDVAYGAPPDAAQGAPTLATNDARVLDAFIYEDEIQFVGNTRNLDDNRAGIYHGKVLNVSGDKEFTLEHIIGDDFEIGYPGISMTGDIDTEVGSIISFLHSSNDRFPGMSAMYYHFNDGYSEMIEIKEGESVINMNSGLAKRWGDYTGSQRKYDDNQAVWVSGSFGSGFRNRSWIASLAAPGAVLDVADLDFGTQKLFPNPTADVFSIEFDIPESGKNININLLSSEAELIEKMFDTEAYKTGKGIYHFNAAAVASGIYLVQINVDGKTVKTHQLIIQR